MPSWHALRARRRGPSTYGTDMHCKLTSGGVLAALLWTGSASAADPHSRELAEIVVTATPVATGRLGTAQPTSVLAAEALTLRLAPSLGETLAGEPGVQSTFYGPAASRPLIRGLGGDRVRILTDGLATLDASGLSEDHAVAIDPALADQIEVIRGPATLLHGSGAAGGLVNVVTNRLHDDVPELASGLVELRGDSALGERAAASRLDAGAGRLALHLDAAWRETDDYRVPGFLESRRLRAEHVANGEEPDLTQGRVPNSASRSQAGGIGGSYVGERWMLGLALSRQDARYGIPLVHDHDDAEDDAGGLAGDVAVDLRQNRLDLAARAELPALGGLILRLRGALTDYRHAEVEPDGAIGTLFQVDGHELRFSVDHGRAGAPQTNVGLQWQEVDLDASGAEAFVPGTRTRTLGLFGFRRQPLARLALEYGLRIDRQRIGGALVSGSAGTAVNASLGGLWPINDRVTLTGHLVRSERHPSATELHADGPHAATRQYEIGDPELRSESGVTLDLGLRYTAGPVTAELSAFTSRYDGFIHLVPTGLGEGGLPVLAYRQQDSRFAGLEAAIEWPPGPPGLQLALTGEYLRGQLQDGGDLPRMPPLVLGARLDWERAALAASLAVQHHFAQRNAADGELPTGGYTALDASLLWRPDWLGAGTLLFLRGSNLLDADARLHTSPLKDRLPLPGRSIGAGLRIVW